MEGRGGGAHLLLFHAGSAVGLLRFSRSHGDFRVWNPIQPPQSLHLQGNQRSEGGGGGGGQG